MVATDSRKWGAFEMEFVADGGIISFPNWGKRVEVRLPECETTFGQYQALGGATELAKTDLTKALLYMVDNIVAHLDNGQPLKCTSNDAIRVHEILQHIGSQ